MSRHDSLRKGEKEGKWPPFSPSHFGSPARGDKAKRRGNENRDARCLVGLVQSCTSFPEVRASVGDVAV